MPPSRFLSARQPSDPIPTSVDAIILGGGPAGTAAAWALSRAQPGIRTLIVERSSSLGAGASRASLENFRTCWPAAPLAQMMRRSVHIFTHADEYLGDGAQTAIHPRQRGYLWCAFSDRQAAGLRADIEHLHGMGIRDVVYLDTDEVAYRFPWLGAQVVAAKYDPTAGWLDSNALIHRYVIAAEGAQVLLDAGDARLIAHSGRVTGVVAGSHRIDAPRVLLAAGAWSVEIAQAAGLRLPVVVRPRQSFVTGWRHEAFPEDAPMLIGSAPYPHVRPEARSGAIFGWEYGWRRKRASDALPADALPPPFDALDTWKDPRFPSAALALLARQFGHAPGEGFADPRYLRGVMHQIGCYVYRSAEAAYRVCEDGTHIPYESERAIIDAHPALNGLYLSVAHVGHGIMSSPAAGEIAACHMLGLPLPDPLYAGFRLDVHWVVHDENAL